MYIIKEKQVGVKGKKEKKKRRRTTKEGEESGSLQISQFVNTAQYTKTMQTLLLPAATSGTVTAASGSFHQSKLRHLASRPLSPIPTSPISLSPLNSDPTLKTHKPNLTPFHFSSLGNLVGSKRSKLFVTKASSSSPPVSSPPFNSSSSDDVDKAKLAQVVLLSIVLSYLKCWKDCYFLSNLRLFSEKNELGSSCLDCWDRMRLNYNAWLVFLRFVVILVISIVRGSCD